MAADGPQLSDVETEVYNAVEEENRLSQEEISKAVGDRSHIEIITAVRRLEEKGVLVPEEDGETWSLNPEGTP